MEVEVFAKCGKDDLERLVPGRARSNVPGPRPVDTLVDDHDLGSSLLPAGPDPAPRFEPRAQIRTRRTWAAPASRY